MSVVVVERVVQENKVRVRVVVSLVNEIRASHTKTDGGWRGVVASPRV